MNEKQPTAEQILFGKKLDERIRQAGLTPHKAAMSVGYSPSNLQKILSGTLNATDDLLKRLSQVPELGTTYRELIGLKVDALEEVLGIAFRLPYFGRVPAGGFRVLLEDTDDPPMKEWPKPVKGSREGLFLLGVEGDSMEPAYPDGSLLLARQVHSFRNGHRHIVETVDGETTFKLVRVKDSFVVTLIPLNEVYQPFDVHRDQVARIYEIVDHHEETVT